MRAQRHPTQRCRRPRARRVVASLALRRGRRAHVV